MRVIVTGATGFLGKRLVYKLRDTGYQPIAMGRNQTVGDQLVKDDIPFVPIDLTNRCDVIESLRGADQIVHCAALSSVWGKEEEFYRANVAAVSHILEACRINGVEKLIHISTPSVYFDYKDKYDIKETDPLPSTFVNAYAKSKKDAEDLVNQACAKGFSTIILRPRGIFGPGDTSLFPRLLTAMNNQGLPLINGGKALMDITYVDNVVDAITLSLTKETKDPHQIYNITNGEPKTFIELMSLLGQKMQIPIKTRNMSFNRAYYSAKALEWAFRSFNIKKEPPVTCYSVGLLAKSMTLDITKARKELGYYPKISIEEGLEEFARWSKASC